MTTILTVLRSGGDFKPEHVQRLAKQVPGLVCLSDTRITGVPIIPLTYTWPGWWAKMEAFKPSIKGDVLLMDLDTLVIRMPEIPKETTVLSSNREPERMNSGFMYLTEEDRSMCWSHWIKNPKEHMRRCVTREEWGDQGFLQPYIGNRARWGNNFVSWKHHCKKGIPDRADVVVFHGKPRPWDVGF